MVFSSIFRPLYVWLQEEEEWKEEEDDQGEETAERALEPVEVEGKIGKAPVFLKCELCGVVLASILSFTHHMRREHKDSDLFRNKVRVFVQLFYIIWHTGQSVQISLPCGYCLGK